MNSRSLRVKGMILAAVSLLAGFANAEPPADYMPLAYVEANPDTYPRINTGFVPNPQTDCIEAKVSFTSVAEAQTIWCARTNNTECTWTVFMMSGGLLRFDYNSKTGPNTLGAGTPFEKGVVYTVTVSNNSFRASNGASFDFECCPEFTSTKMPLVFFFAYAYDPNVPNYRSAHSNYMRLHGVRIWRNGELLHDYVPYRMPKDFSYAPILWDRVSDRAVQTTDCWIGPDCATNLAVRAVTPLIATNPVPRAVTPDLVVTDTTTGRALTPGSDYDVSWSGNEAPGMATAHVRARYGSGTYGAIDVPVRICRDVPAGCTPLAYIEGDGHSWLLTDYMPNPSTDTLRLDFSLTRIETTAFTCARKDDDTKTWSVCLIGSKCRFDYNTVGDQVNLSGQLVKNTPYTFTLANNVLTLNNGNQCTATKVSGFSSTGNPLQLYAFYVLGPNSGRRNTVSYFRTYRCQVWRSGALIHDWAPVRTAEGVVTLADTVTGDILTPQTDKAGAGFIAGPIAPRSFATASVPVQTWDGATACTPVLDVRDAASGAKLTEGTDYTVALAANDAPGRAVATVTGLGGYAGAESVVPFVIARAIPSAYVPLEYIQGSGSSYFKTDYTPNPSADRIEMNLSLTQLGINAALFCARYGGGNDRSYTVFQQSVNTLRFDYFNLIRCRVTEDIALCVDKKYFLRYAGPVFGFGDDVHGSYYPKAGFTAAGSELHLFVDGQQKYFSTHRLFDCSVWRDGAPIRMWVPVKRVSDGVATLYDRMTGTELTPIGTFVAGPKKADFEVFVRNQPWTAGQRLRPAIVVTNTQTGAELVRSRDYVRSVATNVSARFGSATAKGLSGTAYAGQASTRDFALYPVLPEGYERLEYIQGDGKTALLTGITPTPKNDRILASFMPMSMENAGLFCARGISSVDKSWAFWAIRREAFCPRCDYGAINVCFGVILRPCERVCVSVRNQGVGVSNGDYLWVGGSDLSLAGGPLALLGHYFMSGDKPAFGGYSTLRLYSFQYWHDGALTLDLVPVRTPEGVVTMFDYVSGAALAPTGQAGGAFIAGPKWEVDPYEPPPGMTFIVR